MNIRAIAAAVLLSATMIPTAYAAPRSSHGVQDRTPNGPGVRTEASKGYGGNRYKKGSTSPAELFEFHRKRAAGGNLLSTHKLADLYYDGRGVGQDKAKAASLYKQAADRGFVWSKLKYGAMLADGRGVARNREEAKRYLVGSLPSQNSWAMLRLGKMLKTSDPARARALLQKAARKGNAEAEALVGSVPTS
jgi:TPR repeat protein